MNRGKVAPAASGSAQSKPRRKPNPKAPRQEVRLLAPEARLAGCPEVALGFSAEQVKVEALRCLQCKDPKCVEACPLHIDIKAFVAALADGDAEAALQKINEQNPFPGICGRVCQHELFCEKACLLGKKLQPVAIGSLERFVADQRRRVPARAGDQSAAPQGPRIALVGSGPASLLAAYDLVRKGYRVTVFEALHELGGVLSYGIPNFRLPREILHEEIDLLRRLGLEFRTDFIVGKSCSVQELFEEGYAAVFLGTGAGLPHLMGIPGENLIGVYTANEFLTRINLMEAYKFPDSDTPVRVGKRTIVVGGGNAAMDAARWARRLGSETTIMFRRGRSELRARVEEITRAEEEGLRFEFLAAPVRLLGDGQGDLREMECVRMRLGEPDDSGRPSPVPLPGSEYRIPVETVVMAIGQGANPIVQKATPQLLTNHGRIAVDAAGHTSMSRVFAGGDVCRGGSTVILAMRDGRAAAEAIDRAIQGQNVEGAGAAQRRIPAASASPNRILAKQLLTPQIAWLEVEAPAVARHWKPGQFVVIRPTAHSERIPLTILDGDEQRGRINLVVQAVGRTSQATVSLGVGDLLADLLGPLGQPARIEKVGNVLCVAGGLGVAEVLPVARGFRQAGNRVTVLAGARSASQILLEGPLRAAADEVLWSTDDRSAGFGGTVVDLMRAWKTEQMQLPDLVHVIGPIPMMRAVAEVTRRWNVPTFASLNPIMVDGTGMCGGCRVTVGGRVHFACVDGPEFNAHQVDFDELGRRARAYVEQERLTHAPHSCPVGLKPAQDVHSTGLGNPEATRVPFVVTYHKAFQEGEHAMRAKQSGELVSIIAGSTVLEGVLRVPEDAEGLVILARGRGRGLCPRANSLANLLPRRALATLLVDLLAPVEDALYENRLNVNLLADRLTSVVRWTQAEPEVSSLPLGVLGLGTAAAAALKLASLPGSGVGAVVSVGGRPDLAGEFASPVPTPTLFLIGGNDDLLLDLNRQAYNKLQAEKQLVVIPGVSSLFEEFGALEAVAHQSSEWFVRHLPSYPVPDPYRDTLAEQPAALCT